MVKETEKYRPYLMGFYAHWSNQTSSFLSMLKVAVEEFRFLDADVRFGLLDTSRQPEGKAD
jgi:hypothetical protein